MNEKEKIEKLVLLSKKQKELADYKIKKEKLMGWLKYLASVSQLRCIFEDRATKDGSFKEMDEYETKIHELNKQIEGLEKELEI